jgi:O-antigen ligase
MFENILEKPKYLILLSVVLSAAMAFASPYLYVLPALLIFVFLLFRYETGLYYFILIAALLLTNSQTDKLLRTIVVIGGYSSLTFLFLKKYGLNTSEYPKIPKHLGRYVAFISAAVFVSSILSENPTLCLGIFFRQTAFFFLCYLLYSLIENEKTIYIYLHAVMLSGFAIAVSILFEFYQSGFTLYYQNKEFMRFAGLIDTVNTSGFIISISIIIACAFLFLPRYKSVYYKIAYGGIILLNIVGLFFTNSRASIISAVIGTFFIIYKNNREFFKKVILGIAAVVLFLLVTTNLYDVISVYFRVTTVFSVRDYLWQVSENIARDHPIFGVGPEMSRFYVDRYFPVEIGTWEEGEIRTIQSFQMPGLAHNYFLSFMAELGIPGIISILLLFYAFYKLSSGCFKMSSVLNKNTIGIITGIAGLGAGILFRAYFETMGIMTYGWIMNDLSTWVCIMCVAYIYLNPGKFNQSEKEPPSS